jgi:hypothetical protein
MTWNIVLNELFLRESFSEKEEEEKRRRKKGRHKNHDGEILPMSLALIEYDSFGPLFHRVASHTEVSSKEFFSLDKSDYSKLRNSTLNYQSSQSK